VYRKYRQDDSYEAAIFSVDTSHNTCYIVYMSGERAYTVSEVEKLTGISRRTIHFYVKEGVIPAPEGVGGGARYGEVHLVRLNLTRELQKSHLKLSGIREALERLSLDQMRGMLHTARDGATSWDQRSLERWLEERVADLSDPEAEISSGTLEMAEAEAAFEPTPPPPASVREEGPAWNQSMLDLDDSSATGALSSSRAAGSTPGHEHAPGRPETWERIVLAQGLEILVRSDLVQRYRRVIREMAELIRKWR
jgi:DNA-binding transcriptional MerR regulator